MKKIRYAIVGLGHIAQTAMMPGFLNSKNSEITAFVSHDPVKLKKLAKKYKVSNCYGYEDFDKCLESGEVDAVYIALPNSMHREYVEKAAKKGIHILCEKPMAVTAKDCAAMIKVVEQNKVKLMIAYRLHFERANMRAVEIANSGQLGELRIFNSTFSMQVRDKDNIRLQKDKGGGTLYDIGIYCINAARYLFRSEPIEVMAISANNGEKRFSEIDEMTSVIMKFPKERLAVFTTSFGAAESRFYEIVGTKGVLCLENPYEYIDGGFLEVKTKGKTKTQKFSNRDQFGAELTYFSNCVLNNLNPEPSGLEGLADVRIIEALYQSAKTGKAVQLPSLELTKRPSLAQELRKKPITEPEGIHVTSAAGD